MVAVHPAQAGRGEESFVQVGGQHRRIHLLQRLDDPSVVAGVHVVHGRGREGLLQPLQVLVGPADRHEDRVQPPGTPGGAGRGALADSHQDSRAISS
ncbi:hypothetical protein BJF90_13810 [Pseudonocardia sp. CNS-004]|nr:hypothetical protein BJF90_13810 [Pseudonocardia sp. CNS-004]